MKKLLCLFALFAFSIAHGEPKAADKAEAVKKAITNSDLKKDVQRLEHHLDEAKRYLEGSIKGQAGSVRKSILGKLDNVKQSVEALKDSGANVEKGVAEVRDSVSKLNVEVLQAVEKSSAILMDHQKVHFQNMANNFLDVNRTLGRLEERVHGMPKRESLVLGSFEEILGRKVLHVADFNIKKDAINNYYLGAKTHMGVSTGLYLESVIATRNFIERAFHANSPVTDVINNYQLNTHYKQVSKTVNHVMANFLLNALPHQIALLIEKTEVYDQRRGTLNVAKLYGEALIRNLWLIDNTIRENSHLEKTIRENKFVQHAFRENYKVTAESMPLERLIWAGSPGDKMALEKLRRVVELTKKVGVGSMDALRNGVKASIVTSKEAAQLIKQGVVVAAVEIPKGTVKGIVQSPQHIKSGVTYIAFTGPKALLKVLVGSIRSGAMKITSVAGGVSSISSSIYLNVVTRVSDNLSKRREAKAAKAASAEAGVAADSVEKSTGFVITIGSKFTKPFVMAAKKVGAFGSTVYNSKPVSFFLVPVKATGRFVKKTVKGSYNAGKAVGNFVVVRPAKKGYNLVIAIKANVKNSPGALVKAFKSGKTRIAARFSKDKNTGEVKVDWSSAAAEAIEGKVTAESPESRAAEAVQENKVTEIVQENKTEIVVEDKAEKAVVQGEKVGQVSEGEVRSLQEGKNVAPVEASTAVVVGDSVENTKDGKTFVVAKTDKGTPAAVVELGKGPTQALKKVGKKLIQAPKAGAILAKNATVKGVVATVKAPVTAYKLLGRLGVGAAEFVKKTAGRVRAKRAATPAAVAPGGKVR